MGVQPKPYTLHTTHYTLHPTPYTLHPTPYTLHSTPYTLHPTPYTLHPAPCTLHPAPCTLHPTLHPAPYPRLANGELTTRRCACRCTTRACIRAAPAVGHVPRNDECVWCSGKRMQPHRMPPAVAAIRRRLCCLLGVDFDGVLANYYADASVHIRYHSDPDQGILWATDTAVVSCQYRFRVK